MLSKSSFSLLIFYLLMKSSISLYSIQCCTGDETCSSKPVDCPSNICFKLIISNDKEERGCLADLINLVNSANKDNRKLTNENSLTSSSTNDQCHRLGSSGNGMSLCKCTSHLCNSSIQNQIFNNKLLFVLFVCFVHLIFIVN